MQCALQDKAGNLWFGCNANGIYVFDGKVFRNFTKENGLCHRDILCSLEDSRGNIWFGTRNGLIRYRPAEGIPEITNFSNNLISARTINRVTHELEPYHYQPAENFVWSMMEDDVGNVWFGTNKGIFIYNPREIYRDGQPVFTAFPGTTTLINKDSLKLLDVQSMLQDKNGNIWFASGAMKGEGMCCYDGKTLEHYEPGGNRKFRSIRKMRDGSLVVLSFTQGLFQYTCKGFSKYLPAIGMLTDSIRVFAEDARGNLWMGMASNDVEQGGGLYRYDGKHLTHYSTQDGLPHNSIFCLLPDASGNLWIGTRGTGLCRYNGKEFEDYTEGSGVR